MTEEKTDKQEVKRPGQALILILVRIVITLISLYPMSFILPDYYYDGHVNKFQNAFLLFFLFIFLTNFVSVLEILLKNRIGLILSIIFSIIVFCYVFFIFIVNVISLKGGSLIFLAPLFVEVFLFYLAISCLKHPFYNQKKLNK